MNKKILSITLATCLLSCSDNSMSWSEKVSPRERSSLQLATRSFSLHSFRWEEAFEENSMLSVYVISEHPDTMCQRFTSCRRVKAKAVRQTNGRIEWKTTEAVGLDTRPVRIYACYPYQPAGMASPASLRLRISPLARLTPDYRYGRLPKGHKPVCDACPYALIATEHLLSRLSFHLETDEKAIGNLCLEEIQVGNCPGQKAFCQEAVLDVLSGRLTTSPAYPGATVSVPHQPIRISGSPTPVGTVRVLPTAVPLQAGEIEIRCTISGKKYRYAFPAGTIWRKGCEYRYHFRLTGRRLSLLKTTLLPM